MDFKLFLTFFYWCVTCFFAGWGFMDFIIKLYLLNINGLVYVITLIIIAPMPFYLLYFGKLLSEVLKK